LLPLGLAEVLKHLSPVHFNPCQGRPGLYDEGAP
jgi:hypothetical protein